MSALPGQQARVYDDSLAFGSAYDAVRDRIVVLGSAGELRELDGAVWRACAQPRRPASPFGRLVYDTAHGSVLGCLENSMQLFRYDGAQMRDIATAGGPPPRSGFACAYDSTRAEFVLFGGEALSALADTWLFDGSAWRQATPVASPSGRRYASMAYDLARSRVVMFGGFLGTTASQETHEWDGVNWTAVAAANPPSPRAFAGMAYDARNARTVLFGGAESISTNVPTLDDTWAFDGQQWQQIAVPTPPLADRLPSLCFDYVRSEIVMIDGLPADPVAAEPMSFDGVRWQALGVAPHPGRRSQANVVAAPGGDGMIVLEESGSAWHFDGHAFTRLSTPAPNHRLRASTAAAPGMAYVFGGFDLATSSYLGDLWIDSGAGFAPVPATGPSPRTGAALAYDEARARLVLFGGSDFNGLMGDTWTFDGIAWQQVVVPTSPQPRSGGHMVYDPMRGVIVMAGGTGLGDTWEWNGAQWSQVGSGDMQLNFPNSALAYDRQRQLVTFASDLVSTIGVMTFDGQHWSTSQSIDLRGNGLALIGYPYRDGLLIHTMDTVAALEMAPPQVLGYGNGCGSAIDLGADEWARLGAAGFGMQVVAAPAGALIALLAATHSVNVPIGGCTLLVAPDQAVVFAPASALGHAHVSLPLPANRAFLGLSLFFQAAALDAQAPGGFVLTRGVRVAIGD